MVNRRDKCGNTSGGCFVPALSRRHICVGPAEVKGDPFCVSAPPGDAQSAKFLVLCKHHHGSFWTPPAPRPHWGGASPKCGSSASVFTVPPVPALHKGGGQAGQSCHRHPHGCGVNWVTQRKDMVFLGSKLVFCCKVGLLCPFAQASQIGMTGSFYTEPWVKIYRWFKITNQAPLGSVDFNHLKIWFSFWNIFTQCWILLFLGWRKNYMIKLCCLKGDGRKIYRLREKRLHPI